MKPVFYRLGTSLLYHLPEENQSVLCPPERSLAALVSGTPVEILRPAAFFKKFTSGYLLVSDEAFDVACDALALGRLATLARETGAGLVYSDFLADSEGALTPHPLNDYRKGSIRDDFNFGPFYLLSAKALFVAIQRYGAPPNDPSTALYDLRLKLSIDHSLIHLPEFLYRASARKIRKAKRAGIKTEAQFAYVATQNAARQKKLEKIATAHLKRISAWLPPSTRTTLAPPKDEQWKASIIIPVFNRQKTIGEALKSALAQETDFAFNILIVDNHSTDGTTDLLKRYCARFPHVHVLVPFRRDLGIGGCWNEAVYSSLCGRYAVQLDSDDLYSSPKTLQKIVDKLRRGPYAMVVGSYTLVNEQLQPIPPGLIDHREWTKANGHNNLLRINGMGAPRAFDVAALRQTGFPNVSYGEDYAVALKFTREYKIGRIYESLYLCRRWTDNTDSALSIEKQNRNDYYKDRLRTLEISARQHLCRERSRPFPTQQPTVFADYPGTGPTSLPELCLAFFESQKRSWPALSDACLALAQTQTRELDCGTYRVTLQFNPARAVSGSAVVDPESIRRRPCFLCDKNRPPAQHALAYRSDYLILCNPAPIFDRHFTVVHREHRGQDLVSAIHAFLQIARDVSPAYSMFYNGPASGASAPDHLHFQMIPTGALPFIKQSPKTRLNIEKDSVQILVPDTTDRAIVILEAANANSLAEVFLAFLKAAQRTLAIPGEPPCNVFCFYEKGRYRLTIFLRAKHRPDAYYAEGEERIFVSPGAIDLAGVLVIPETKDFKRLDCDTVRGIYREVSLENETLMRCLKKLRRRTPHA